MKIVLDTNCLLIAVPGKSDYHCILSDFQKGRYTLYCSNDIFMEYEEMLMRFYPKKIAGNVLNFLFNSINLFWVTPYFQWTLITADPDDNKFADCALNAGADYLVTNDQHFNVLNSLNFPPIKVINIETFKKML